MHLADLHTALSQVFPLRLRKQPCSEECAPPAPHLVLLIIQGQSQTGIQTPVAEAAVHFFQLPAPKNWPTNSGSELARDAA